MNDHFDQGFGESWDSNRDRVWTLMEQRLAEEPDFWGQIYATEGWEDGGESVLDHEIQWMQTLNDELSPAEALWMQIQRQIKDEG